jgi:hypothetical protein
MLHVLHDHVVSKVAALGLIPVEETTVHESEDIVEC